jgi:hypothetical protein
MTIEHPVIVVTGATGNHGYAALKCFLKDDDLQRKNTKIRAAVYSKGKNISLIRDLSDLDKTVELDADVYDSRMDKAFEGVDYAFIIPSSSRRRVEHVANYVKAAKQSTLSDAVFIYRR